MKAITFLIHTHQPILATSLQGDPNSDVSYPYIPGSMIRGMLISRYLREHTIPEADILDNTEVTRLFFDSTTRYLNAYPYIANNSDSDDKNRCLPIPRCLYKNKGIEFSEGEEQEVYDFSQNKPNDDDFSPKSLGEDIFCRVEYRDIQLYKVKRRINIHNQRDRKRGRGTDGSGAVFRYDAIDAGQTFQSVVLCDSEKDAEIINLLLTHPQEKEQINAWLGGSQSAGYGHVTIELLPDENNWNEVKDENNWNEVKIDWEDRSERQNNLTITLLSDTTLRDDYGQNTTATQELVKVVSETLGVQLKHIDTYATSTIVGGFNRKWGLPLPQVAAFAAGSVFVFKSEPLESQKVDNLERQGIGERRVDGFGRIVFNWLREESTFSAIKIDSTANSKPEEKPLSPESQEISQRMAERLLRQKLDELLLERLEANTPKDSTKISNSQLSRLMIVARKALAEGKPDPLYELLGRDENSDNLTKTARTQFKQTEMSNGKKLDEQIRDWLKNPDIWILSAWGSRPTVRNRPRVTIAQQSEILDDNNQLSLEYTLRLIIAVTKKMMKDKNND
ncbi:RAMP superfamily CRISPR-associated protein [Argonema antarcticum]|uniref:RAMP superfamily CRISPR-associated protein n=1 Tax=Argonema antarcticum TaxID=2942763 RepID=UPI0020123FCA|nr:type III-B CRISPR module-associated Cmr3 family protein [Argonema antarcticum]MCL1473245.1 hypothetical protein [Argonema antarcticum A004/B2]